MPNVSQINADNTLYDVKDAFMRSITPEAATTQNKLSTAADVAGENISGSATGTAITLTDSADARVLGLTIKGRSHKSKNLFDYKQVNQTYMATYIYNTNSIVITTNRTSSNEWAQILFDVENVDHIKGKNVALSVESVILSNNKYNDWRIYLLLYNNNTQLSEIFIDANTLQRSLFIPNDNITNVNILLRCSQSKQDEIGDTVTFNKIQLELGSTATNYEPYGIHSVGDDGLTVTLSKTGETNRTAAFTTGLPLCSIPDTTIHDELNAGKEVVKQCGGVELDDLTFTYANNLFSATVTGAATGAALCEKYTYKAITSALSELANGEFTMYSNSGTVKVYINDTNYSDAATFTTAVAGVKLIYPLATPTTTPLTAAELAAFRQLRTFNETTNITIIDEPIFAIGYLKNTENGKALAAVQDDIQRQIDAITNS